MQTLAGRYFATVSTDSKQTYMVRCYLLRSTYIVRKSCSQLIALTCRLTLRVDSAVVSTPNDTVFAGVYESRMWTLIVRIKATLLGSDKVLRD